MTIERFLSVLAHEGLTELRAIEPDWTEGQYPAAVFKRPERIPNVITRLQEKHAGRNIFIGVATRLREGDGTKLNLGFTSVVWCDVDHGQACESLDALKFAIMMEGLPEPTMVVRSGGGYHCYWRLTERLDLTSEANRLRLESVNYGLAQVLGGDERACDSARVLRPVGTTNYPDARKRERGRVPAPVELLVCEEGRTYGFDAFAEWEERGRAAAMHAHEGRAATYEPREWDADELPPAVVEALRDPAVERRFEGDGDGLRDPDDQSAVCWSLAQMLARKGLEGWEIETALRASREQRGAKVKGDAWYRKTVSKALAETAPEGTSEFPDDLADEACDFDTLSGGKVKPAVEALNRRYFIVEDVGGKARIVFFRTRVYDEDLTRDEIVYQSKEDFRMVHMHRNVQTVADQNGNAKYMPMADAWLTNRNRRQYRQVEYLPGKAAPKGVFNLWRGFANLGTATSWERMRAHIEVILADGDRASADYILKWAAWAVQNPGRQAQVALVFRSPGRGTGKGSFANWLRRLFGQHGLAISSASHVTGRFNAHLQDVSLLFCDEAIAPGDRKGEGVLKSLISEPTIAIEGKGRDLITCRNTLHVCMASNEEWIVPVGQDERRFAIFDVSETRKQNADYFNALHREMREGGGAAMLRDLSSMSLGEWNPMIAIPRTKALDAQQAYSFHPVEELWHGFLLDGELPGTDGGRTLCRPQPDGAVAFTTLSMIEYLGKRTRAQITTQALAKLLKQVGYVKGSDAITLGTAYSNKACGWRIPPLPLARQLWLAARLPGGWEEDTNAVWCVRGEELLGVCDFTSPNPLHTAQPHSTHY